VEQIIRIGMDTLSIFLDGFSGPFTVSVKGSPPGAFGLCTGARSRWPPFWRRIVAVNAPARAATLDRVPLPNCGRPIATLKRQRDRDCLKIGGKPAPSVDAALRMAEFLTFRPIQGRMLLIPPIFRRSRRKGSSL
jgi:hypothetical protein